MNARMYPRATRFAFPKSCEYACALERPAPNKAGKIVWLVFAAGCLELAAYYLWKVYG